MTKPWRSCVALLFGLELLVLLTLVTVVGQAAPGNPVLQPPRHSHTVPLTTTVSISYDEPISATTVTSRTFAVHAMQSGLLTGTYGVSGGTIVLTPTHPFHQGEPIYAIATTGTLGLDGSEPISATQWQFQAGQVADRCVWRLTDIQAGLAGVGWGAVAWGDYDGDDDLDVILTGYYGNGPVSRIYRNDGGLFTNIGAGLVDVYESAVAWGDYDNDGDLDLLLAGRAGSDGHTSRIYRNDAGTFTDIGAGLTGVWYAAAAWGDYDNDGDLDVVLAGSSPGLVTRLYRNDGGSFTLIPAGLPGFYRGSLAWGDYDNDGDLDILLTGDGPGGDLFRIYRNTDGSFADIGAGLPGVQVSSAEWGDYDNDGDIDILVTGYHIGTGHIARIYRNDAGSFVDIGAGLTGEGPVAWSDYDNDGDLDVLLLYKLYQNDGGSFSYVNLGVIAVGGGSSAWGDYDADGDVDLLVTGWVGNYRQSRIYRNDDCADVAIVKGVSPAHTVPQQAITYTLTFSHTARPGAPVAAGITITDHIPVSVTVTGIASSGAAITETETGPDYVWEVQNLAAGQGGVITITGMLSPGLPAGHVFTNTAAIGTTTWEGNTENNQSLAAIRIAAAPLLTTTKQANVETAVVGEMITYTYRVTNTGNITVGSIQARDDRLGLVSLGSTSLAPGASACGTLTYTIAAGDLPGPLVNTVTVTGTVAPTTTLSATATAAVCLIDAPIAGLQAFNDSPTVLGNSTALTATITGGSNVTYTWALGDGSHGSGAMLAHIYAEAGPYTATVTASNSAGSASASTAVTITTLADLALGQIDSDDPVIAGARLIYTLVVTNAGPHDAVGTTVADVLPEGTSLLSASPGCNEVAGRVSCGVGTLTSGDLAIRSITVTVSPDAVGPLVNHAEVTATTVDPVVANNADTEITSVVDRLCLYVCDFEVPVGNEWSDPRISTTPTGRSFLGEFGNDAVSLSLGNLPAHTQVSLNVDVYIIRSWDGNETEPSGGLDGHRVMPILGVIGPDIWRLAISGGDTLLRTTFSNWDVLGQRQAYPGTYPGASFPARTGADENQTLGYVFDEVALDSVYHLSFESAHTDETIEFEFEAMGLQMIHDESWGLDNLRVCVHAGAVRQEMIYLPLVVRYGAVVR